MLNFLNFSPHAKEVFMLGGTDHITKVMQQDCFIISLWSILVQTPFYSFEGIKV